jgi:hypothetical protein
VRLSLINWRAHPAQFVLRRPAPRYGASSWHNPGRIRRQGFWQEGCREMGEARKARNDNSHAAQQDGPQRDDGQSEARRSQAARETRDWSGQTGYRPNVNQPRHEPMPASRHDDRQQAGVQSVKRPRDT